MKPEDKEPSIITVICVSFVVVTLGTLLLKWFLFLWRVIP